MIVTELKPRIPDQKCPLCGELQAVLINGMHLEYLDPNDIIKASLVVEKDKGYSFCNCHNIFFTDWSNMDLREYDDNYLARYNTADVKVVTRRFAQKYIPLINEVLKGGKFSRFLEIGSPNDSILEVAEEHDMYTIGLDLIKRDSRYPFLEYNFENYETSDKYDIIWASHIFEHFKDPIGMLKKCYDILTDDGVLFIAMPDPWFVDWNSDPYCWIHWHIKEHYILWDLDSFCGVMESVGFQIIKKHRNTTYDFLCSGDFHIVAQKKV